MDCGYAQSIAGLDFHHRDAASKEFGLAEFNGSLERLLAEAVKCDLICANCHRLRHLAEDTRDGEFETSRRRLKKRAVAYLGGACEGCGRVGPAAIFDFHHRDAAAKEFGLSQDGVTRPWPKVVAELAKCVMLCANCHREVHAGVRVLDVPHRSLAEEALAYAA